MKHHNTTIILLCSFGALTQYIVAAATTCINNQQPWVGANGQPTSCSAANSTDVCPSGYQCQSAMCCPVQADEHENDNTSPATDVTIDIASQSVEESTVSDDAAAETLIDSKYCEPNSKVFRGANGTVVSCNDHDKCLPPADCSSKGYCCLRPLNQEPPPVGCPFGSRPLKNTNGEEISCIPGQPGSCPGDTLCYQDQVSAAYHCCGKDPGEGCPSGSRAVKVNGRVQSCVPGSATQVCPGQAMCQWSYVIDRYQCCEPDNGCPGNSKPLMTPSNTPQMCKSDGSAPCPSNYACEFNFWTASHQCCGSDVDYGQIIDD